MSGKKGLPPSGPFVLIFLVFFFFFLDGCRGFAQGMQQEKIGGECRLLL